MKTSKTLITGALIAVSALFATGCATSSSLSTGEQSFAATSADSIVVLTSYPDAYTSVGLVEASAPKGYLRKPKHATELALAALKKEAASLGAQAVVLKSYASEQVPDFSLGDGDDLGILFSTTHKKVTAEAIRY